jgi:hypothetical protein
LPLIKALHEEADRGELWRRRAGRLQVFGLGTLPWAIDEASGVLALSRPDMWLITPVGFFSIVQEPADVAAEGGALPGTAPVVREVRAAGITSVRAVAEELNHRKVPTPRGGDWHPTTVARVLVRIG